MLYLDHWEIQNLHSPPEALEGDGHDLDFQLHCFHLCPCEQIPPLSVSKWNFMWKRTMNAHCGYVTLFADMSRYK